MTDHASHLCLRSAAAAATLVPAVASDCCAAAAAAAVAARHACCGVFLFLNKADVSSTDIAPYVSGRSPQTLRICSGAYVATRVSTEQE